MSPSRVALVLLLLPACAPRKRMEVYTPPPETSAPPAQPVATAAPPPAPPPVLGPAVTPNGVFFPPGWAVPAPGAPLPFPPFPFPGTAPTTASTQLTPTPSAPTAAPAPTSTPAPAPESPAPTATGDTWPPSSTALEDEVVVEVNARRAAGATCGTKTFPAAPPLAVSPTLRVAARGHSKDMATQNFFDHQSPDGRQPADRIKAAGWSGGGYTGENIAAGNATAKATVQQWMNSQGHCENIMDPNYQFIGVGYYNSPSSKFKHYWTQTFGGK